MFFANSYSIDFEFYQSPHLKINKIKTSRPYKLMAYLSS